MKKIKALYDFFLKSKGVTTDTRDDVKEKIFFALSGLNFNGNTFAKKAVDNGALLAVIDDEKYKLDDNYFLVGDVLTTMQELAKYHRIKSAIPVLAITGSNGKTTTKELIAKVLSSSKTIISTKGNLNNHIGVPLTLLTISSDTEVAVIEMGANHIGEIGFLCDLAIPDIGIITNIGKAHLEGFGSYEGVIAAKNELFEFITKNHGTLIVNSDDELLSKLSEKAKKITYGKNDSIIEGEIIASHPTIKIKWGNNGVIKICNSKIYGNYNFYNILAAIASGILFKIDHDKINKSIEDYKSDNNRSQILETKNNYLILDAYNANPYSMKEAIISFCDSNFDNPLILLGDMFELGDYSVKEHQEIVDLVKSLGFRNVILTGKEFHKTAGHDFIMFTGTNETYQYLKEKQVKDSQVLIKGSRGMQMEKLIEVLQ